MEEDPKYLSEWCRRARSAGARGAEALLERWDGNRVEAENGRVQRQSAPAGHTVRMRVWLEQGRAGEAVGTTDELPELVQLALEQAGKAQPDPVAGPYDRLASPLRGLGIADRRYDGISDEDRVDVVLHAERTARAVDRRVVPGRFWYLDRKTQRTFSNSRGVSLSEVQTVYQVGGEVSAAGTDERLSQCIDARSYSSIASLPLGTNAGRAIVERLKRGEALYGAARVLLWPEAVAQLFGCLAQALADGDRRPDLFLRSLDQPLDRRLHLLDDGVVPGGLRTSSFDDRGVRPVPVVLIREGQLGDDYVDLRTGRAEGRQPTGHEGSEGMTPRNLAMRSGTKSVSATLTEHSGQCLSLRVLPDLGHHLDLATGLLCGTVSGAVFQGNKHVGSVRQATLRGHLGQVLRSIHEVCSDTDRVGHVDAPAMIVDGFEVAP